MFNLEYIVFIILKTDLENEVYCKMLSYIVRLSYTSLLYHTSEYTLYLNTML